MCREHYRTRGGHWLGERPLGARRRGRRRPPFAIVVYEPGAGEVMRRDSAQRMGDVFGGVGALAAEGKLAEAARAFIAGGSR
jgi:hypothetical protein